MDLGSTRKACATVLMDAEARLLDKLQSTATISFSSDALLMLDASGIELARFTPEPAEPGEP
jgi:heat shock protein HslJ